MTDAIDERQEDWHARWREDRIGFHQPEVNRLLQKFWPELVPDTKGVVFVPLCGKTHDMTWLADRGHQVIGVELSEKAARDYFAERGLTPTEERVEDFIVLNAGNVEIWCGDIFAFPAARLESCIGAYDRASLIALPPKTRARYADAMVSLLPPTAPTLLLTISYDQSEADGPPFSVPDNEVETHYAGRHGCDVVRLGTRDATEMSTNLTAKGVSKVMSSVFTIGGAETA